MKYIGLIFCLALTFSAAVHPAAAQTQSYVASGLTVNSPGYDSTQPDIITIQKRVDDRWRRFWRHA